jgi:hypothetical protein
MEHNILFSVGSRLCWKIKNKTQGVPSTWSNGFLFQYFIIMCGYIRLCLGTVILNRKELCKLSFSIIMKEGKELSKDLVFWP